MRKFKSLLTIILFIIISLACNKLESVKEIPDGLTQVKPCPTLYDSIIGLFPEKVNNLKRYPQLFGNDNNKSIVLNKSSHVYVTYISEGANYSNTVGWYSYHQDNPPTDINDIQLNILFPHVSDNILIPGATVKLQNRMFDTGTVIGFFLIVNGWKNGSINYDNTIHFTDYAFNLDQHQQHVFFIEKNCDDLVLAFEDVSLKLGGDKDFNDIIFTVFDNNQGLATTSIVLDDVEVL